MAPRELFTDGRKSPITNRESKMLGLETRQQQKIEKNHQSYVTCKRTYNL